MQFKKLAAITGSALMAGLSLAAPVLAASATKLGDIKNLAGAADSTVNFPIFVIGARAQTADVAGAVDVAVNLASNVVKTTAVTVPGTAAAITGGVSMTTPTNPLTMWNNFASSKQVLTANDLPEILNAGSYADAASVTTPYSQYLTFTSATTNGQVVYDKPNGGTTPGLGLKFTGNYQIYNYQLAFTKQISEVATSGTVTNMGNTPLKIMGRDWTITTATTGTNSLALTLLSGKNAQTVTTEAPATYVVGDKTYTVKLVAVGTINNVDAATIAVSGGNLAAEETLQILTGGTKAPVGDPTLIIGVTSIFKTTKTGAIDSATVFVGADKLELADTDVTDTTYYAGVKLNGNSVNDVTVRMTGTASTALLTLNTIEVQWLPSLENFITAGNSVLDPAFGGFKIFFGGISPAIDDTASRETISITPSGTTASLSFKTVDGQTFAQNFVQSSAAGLGSIALKDAGGYEIFVVEGATVAQNQYMVLGQNDKAGSAQNPFGHVLRVLSLQTSAASTSQFQDVASGTTIQVTGGNTTMYLDGQAYKVCVWTTNSVQFFWGTSATTCGSGSAYEVYPAIQTSKGAWVALTKYVSITGLINNTNYTLNLPTGSFTLNTVYNAPGGTGAANYTASPLGPAATGGTVDYTIMTTITTGTTIGILATDNAASPATYQTPGVLIVEGLDESTARNAIAMKLDADAIYNRVDLNTNGPAFSGTATSSASAGISGTTQNRYMDQYGSYVMFDSTMPGTFSLSYPTSQAQATVGVGKSPSASGGAVGGTLTTQTVLPITTDVVYLDNDPAVASLKTTRDVVLVGGPCINDLVKELATGGTFPYTCDNWPGRNFGRVQLIANAFATGKTALVIAGTRAEETDLAAQMVQQGLNGASDTIKNGLSTEITGSVTSPVYT
jgi:hypothetical protein